MRPKALLFSLLLLLIVLLQVSPAQSCTRFIYTAGNDQVLTGRSMDWLEDLKSDFWIFSRGMQRDGGVGKDSIQWTAKYGSVIISGYDAASADGMNEKGLVANLLYLAESDYGHRNGKPGLSVAAWVQYVLDNYATVNEAVADLRTEPFRLVAAHLPNGSAPTLHLAISDPTDDSAIFEYIDGTLTIHHGKKFKVMTNSPIYERQLALDDYWQEIGGLTMLPGTNRASDRYVRASFYVDALPKFKDTRMAVSAAFSVIRNVSVPLGITTPGHPNISTTIWRSVFDQKNRIYYYESAISPNIFWVELKNIDFSASQPPRKLSLKKHPVFAGDVSGKFLPATPFTWLAP
ncbi:linear amide C-N hydrolase [Pseudodesulfovibrio sp. JC047]|uniref:linear amide C-N hydrolase n=1 Tax=Pseudodesulfovibrio sp. JC047 TaxID=2683199 RepID=UPI0013D6C8BD|nr:linear amide C-N hydrolase [Pseudodesulfovibrio sp. JC047]NDV18357.1 linear amide C-N hydrolase [Pseudodesulfovibrio sp. JC047]